MAEVGACALWGFLYFPRMQLLALCSLAAAAEVETCFDMGFTSSLLCSSCDALAKHVPSDSSLEASCRNCCTEGATATRYNSADLRVCK